jgi:hypothetical protein
MTKNTLKSSTIIHHDAYLVPLNHFKRQDNYICENNDLYNYVGLTLANANTFSVDWPRFSLIQIANDGPCQFQ